MSAVEEYMAWLQKDPELYYFFTKTKLAMRVVKALAKEEELTVEDLQEKLRCERGELEHVLDMLADFKLAERERFNETWIYYLSKQGERLHALYEKAKKEL